METSIPLWGIITLALNSIIIPLAIWFIKLAGKVDKMETAFDLKLAKLKAENKDEIVIMEKGLSQSIKEASDSVNRMANTVNTLAEGMRSITRLLERHDKQIVDLEQTNFSFYKEYGGLLKNLKND